MKRPPNIALAGAVAIVAFGLIVLTKHVLTPTPPTPWLTDEAAGFARAREQHKAVMIDFHATWSMPSVDLSQTLDELRPIIDRDFVAVRIDISNGEDTVRERYGVVTDPAVVLVDTEGHVLERIDRMRTIDEVRSVVERAAKKRR